MTLTYSLRLVVLGFAVFFLVNAAAGLLVRLATPQVMRWATWLRARDGARLMFALRVLPALLALVIVAGLCVPAYLWLEPGGIMKERAGWVVFVLAALGAGLFADALARALGALLRSRKLAAECGVDSAPAHVADDHAPVVVMEAAQPVLALVGFWRPRIVVSSAVLRELSTEELQAALAHERAHCESRENLKRFLLLLTPDVLPFCRFLGVLEQGWARFAEWCADDRATGGDEERSASLAMALVRVARMGVTTEMSAISTSFYSSDHSLAERVERLVGSGATGAEPNHNVRRAWRLALPAALLVMAIAVMQPETLSAVHHFLEFVLHA